MKKFILFLSLFIFQTNYSQIDYDVLIDRLYSAADDSDGSGDEDPTWYVRMQDNSGGALQSSGCFHTTHPYNSWYDVNFVFFGATNSSATSFSTEMLCWEEDGCGSDCSYDPFQGNPLAGGFCLNGDESLAPAGTNGTTYGSTQTIDIFTNPPCSWNEDEISIFGAVNNGSPSEYKAEIQVNWSPNGGVNPGSIAGDQTVCPGTSPSGLTSLDDGTGGNATFGGYFSYQWEQDIGCTGAFSDITGANFSVYFPGAITQTTCYRRKTTSACGDFFSNSVTVSIETESIAPSNLTASSNTLCSGGGTVDLTVSGGSLGAGASWELYSGSCGGTLVTSNSTGVFNGVNVNSTETFYVLASGTCNATACVSTTIDVLTPSTDPISILASNTNICSGDLISLDVNGGSLGTGDSWEWYSGSCGGTSEGSGASITANPSITTDYFVRAEGACGNSNCANVTISVIPAPISLDSAKAGDYQVCPEDPVVLTAHYSASLPSNYIITWYTGACGAVPIGVGDNITVNPIATTIYYVQCVGTCGVSSCDTVQVNVLDGSTSPGSVTASINNFCVGGTSTLTVNGGTLGVGAQWEWYEGSCASTVIGTGGSINVTPTTSTMYYVRADGSTCGPTACVNIFINVFDLTVHLNPFDTLCQFDSTSFVLSGGTPLGGAYSGTGVNAGIFDPLVAGPGTHTITYSYTDPNGCSDSASEDIVIMESNPPPSVIQASTTEICDGSSSVLWMGTTLGPDYGNDLLYNRMWVWYKGDCGAGTPMDTTYNNFYQTDASGAIVLDINGDTIFQDTSFVVNPSSTTNYYVRAEGGWCEPTDCIGITIAVYNLETNLLSFDNVCGVDVLPFYLTGGIPSGGTYSGNGVSNDRFDPFNAGLGTHTITYTYSYAGCTVTDTETITVTESPINVYHTIEQESCSEGGILIHLHTTGGSGFYSYLWSDGSIEAPLMYAQPGDYTVLVTDANDCSTLHGPINISEELGCIEMPNTFTPNGDGINDTWNLDFSSYGSAQLTVFSKWGKIVAQFNDVIISWDGVYEGVNLPAGTYYYILQLGNDVDQNGPITIVR